MPSLETFECEECGREFKAIPDAQAAESGYGSPACKTAGENLA
ncbi:MAG: hypothetical protein V5A55_06200 [Halovenus sp.]